MRRMAQGQHFSDGRELRGRACGQTSSATKSAVAAVARAKCFRSGSLQLAAGRGRMRGRRCLQPLVQARAPEQQEGPPRPRDGLSPPPSRPCVLKK